MRAALLRTVYRCRVRWAMPHVVVEDSSDLVALYVRPRTIGRRPRTPLIEDPSQLRTLEWEHVDHVWGGTHALRLLTPGSAHCLYLLWDECDWSFQGWYVNLQAPFRRTPVGFDTRDHALDIVVDPDGSWRWKDDDHLELAALLGAFARDEVSAIRAEGERVLREWPFPTGWEDWRPDPAWPIPPLPDRWDGVGPALRE